MSVRGPLTAVPRTGLTAASFQSPSRALPLGVYGLVSKFLPLILSKWLQNPTRVSQLSRFPYKIM